jgi:GrpB-like predicted nucleotidyltransferase (UPF0157 family)
MPSVENHRRRPDVVDPELIGGVEKRQLVIAEADPAWRAAYRDHEVRIREALGDRAVTIEHIGSTSVPGLAAKPIIDVLVVVPDITAEEDYVGPLLAAGYELRVREPGHRLVRTPERDVQVHILEPADPAVDEYLLLRDHLRRDEEDRFLYEHTKRELVARDWSDMNAYAEAKTEVIEAIKGRARSAREERAAVDVQDLS